MKSELLVIADQHAAGNTFPGLVHTARHTMGVCKMCIRDSFLIDWEAAGYVNPERELIEVVGRLPARCIF